jgi:hypothetical protein
VRRGVRGRAARSIRQWRCHPRLADATASIFGLGKYGIAEARRRATLLWQCARAEEGQEPTDPFLLDPTGEMYKPRWRDGARVGTAWDGSAPLQMDNRLPGDDLLRPRAPRAIPPSARG